MTYPSAYGGPSPLLAKRDFTRVHKLSLSRLNFRSCNSFLQLFMNQYSSWSSNLMCVRVTQLPGTTQYFISVWHHLSEQHPSELDSQMTTARRSQQTGAETRVSCVGRHILSRVRVRAEVFPFSSAARLCRPLGPRPEYTLWLRPEYTLWQTVQVQLAPGRLVIYFGSLRERGSVNRELEESWRVGRD